MAESANIARHLPLMAARQPDHPAIKVPRGRTNEGRIDYLTLSFAQLDSEAKKQQMLDAVRENREAIIVIVKYIKLSNKQIRKFGKRIEKVIIKIQEKEAEIRSSEAKLKFYNSIKELQ